jgi:3-phenylpropionate/cinnamic acid dioxygenase small subunit
MRTDNREEISTVEKVRIEAFIFEEARLLDERAYDQWVALFDDNGIYWVPSGKAGDAETAVALIYDSTARLKERLIRMRAPTFWAQTPPTETTRVIGNMVISQAADGGIVVRYNFVMTMLRRGVSSLLSGRVEMSLRRRDEGFALLQKVVRLQERDQPFDNLTFLL